MVSKDPPQTGLRETPAPRLTAVLGAGGRGFDCHRFLVWVLFLHRAPPGRVVPPTRIPTIGKSLGILVLWGFFCPTGCSLRSNFTK